MTTKLGELNSFHSHKERKKETRAKWSTSKLENGACRAPEVWKNGSLSVVGSAICRSRVSYGGMGFATYANFGQPEPA